MLHFMNLITDKPDWDRKFFDQAIIQKWGQEAIDAKGVDVTDRMMDYVSDLIQNPKNI